MGFAGVWYYEPQKIIEESWIFISFTDTAKSFHHSFMKCISFLEYGSLFRPTDIAFVPWLFINNLAIFECSNVMLVFNSH